MTKRLDLRTILVIGSGPIVIGQACEFDYSGTQACKALRSEGYRVVLVNSNPATIMTDPELADATYIEPLTVDVVEKIIDRERPDAILPTVGGQTGLNLAVALARGRRAWSAMACEMIGASAGIAIAHGRGAVSEFQAMQCLRHWSLTCLVRQDCRTSLEEAIAKNEAAIGYPIHHPALLHHGW